MNHYYTLFGFIMASTLPLPWLAQAACAPTPTPDLVVAPAADGAGAAWHAAAPAGVSRLRTRAGQPLWEIFRLADYYVLHYTGCITYTIAHDHISFELLDAAHPEWVQMHLLSSVMAFWLELRGLLVLHASAVALPRGAVGFMASSTGGKSTLAAAAVAAGYPLITDDLLAVEISQGGVLARPGLPLMRLWPGEAAHFVPGWENLPRVEHKLDKRWTPVGGDRWGAFCGEAQPLTRIYVPQRRAVGDANPAVEIMPLTMSDAVIELVRHSFAAALTAASRLEMQRLPRMGLAVTQAPMHRLAYPHGLEHLPGVIEALAAA